MKKIICIIVIILLLWIMKYKINAKLITNTPKTEESEIEPKIDTPKKEEPKKSCKVKPALIADPDYKAFIPQLEQICIVLPTDNLCGTRHVCEWY